MPGKCLENEEKEMTTVPGSVLTNKEVLVKSWRVEESC